MTIAPSMHAAVVAARIARREPTTGFEETGVWLVDQFGDAVEWNEEGVLTLPCPFDPTHRVTIWSSPDQHVVCECDQACDECEVPVQLGLKPEWWMTRSEAQVSQRADPVTVETARPRFRLLSDVELEQLPPIRFLVDGVLPVAAVGAIYGPPGAGKSFLALDMGCSVGTGSTWLGRPTTQGIVVYLAAEGSAGLRQRLAAWKEAQGLVGVSLPLYFVTEPANLLSTVDLAALSLAIGGLPAPPVLIIVDTLHRSMPGGDENSAKDVGLVIEHADRLRRSTGASVLLVHHTAKGADVERGSSSLRGAVDVLLYAKDEGGRRELRCEKAKDWAPFEPIPFELVSAGISCVVRVLNSAESARGVTLKTQDRTALRALSEIALEAGSTISEWRASSGLPDSTFYRTRKWLVENGYVCERERGNSKRYSLTQSGTTAVTPNSQVTLNPLSTSADRSLSHSQGPVGPESSESGVAAGLGL